MKPTHLVTVALALLVACASPVAQYDSAKRRPTTEINVLRDGQKPARPYKEISLLTDDGGLGEQGEIEAKFVKKAKRMGADAIILQPLIRSGGEVKGFSWVETYLYKASVVIFE